MSASAFMDAVKNLSERFPSIQAEYHCDCSGVVTLDELHCKTPGQGIGSRYLAEVVAIADDTDTVLRLVATPIGDLKPRMRPGGRYAIEYWYRRFGFAYENASLHVVGMRRLPSCSHEPAPGR